MTAGRTAAGSTNRPLSTLSRLNEILALLACIALMIVLGWLCRNCINPDGVHYLRLASYYLSGRPDLAVSGHWSPLISCLMAPLLGMGIGPLATARIVVAMSGLVFWLGSLSLLKRLALPPLAVAFGVWCLTFACASWSVSDTSPDLLVAGLVCLAASAALADDWIVSWKRQCLVGSLWALAYFAKAIAFPLCILTCIGLAAWRVVREGFPRAAGTRSVTLTLAVFLALTAPWVTLISIKYHRFTISTAGRTNRVLVGPKTTPPVGSWEKVPEPGRMSPWESFDHPTVWSPFDSVGNAKHQLRLFLSNGLTIGRRFREFDSLSIGLISLPVVMILALFEPAPFRQKKWLSSLVPVLSLASIYLTVYCGDQRYFWVLFPFVLALAFGLAGFVVEKAGVSSVSKYCLFALISFSFAWHPLRDCARIARHHAAENGVSSHGEMARRLREKQLLGPVVGSSERSLCCALYVAYFLNEPWFGDATPATVTQFLTSKAKIIIVNRNEPVAKELASDGRFRDLDQDLFGDSQTAAQSELKAFELLH